MQTYPTYLEMFELEYSLKLIRKGISSHRLGSLGTFPIPAMSSKCTNESFSNIDNSDFIPEQLGNFSV